MCGRHIGQSLYKMSAIHISDPVRGDEINGGHEKGEEETSPDFRLLE